MLKKILAFLLFSTYLHSVELVMWHRSIGADATGSGVYISKLYSPDSGYTAFSLPAGVEDNNYFTIQNSDEIACSRVIPQGTYTIKLRVSNGVDSYVQDITFYVVAGNVQPRLSAGQEHFLLLKNDGEVYSAGKSTWGALGSGNRTTDRTTLQRITSGLPSHNMTNTPAGNTIIDIDASINCSLFLTRHGEVYVTGRTNRRQTGMGDSYPNPIDTPIKNTNLSAHVIVKMSVNGDGSGNYESSSFLSHEGIVLVCGSNYFGKLGLGHNSSGTSNREAVPVSLQDAHNTIDNEFAIQISMGGLHSGILTTSNLYLVGIGNYGQLGDNSTSSSYPLDRVTTVSNIYYVSCGMYTTHLATNTGTVYACGLNSDGQTGKGNTITSGILGQINSSETVLDTWHIRVHGNVTSNHKAGFLANSGGVFVMGSNDSNRLKSGSTSDILSPEEITEVTGTLTSVAFGDGFTILMSSTGSLYSIGTSSSGALASGGTTSKTSYSLISSGTNFAGDNILIPDVITPDMVETTLQNTAFFAVAWSSYQIADAELL